MGNSSTSSSSPIKNMFIKTKKNIILMTVQMDENKTFTNHYEIIKNHYNPDISIKIENVNFKYYGYAYEIVSYTDISDLQNKVYETMKFIDNDDSKRILLFVTTDDEFNFIDRYTNIIEYKKDEKLQKFIKIIQNIDFNEEDKKSPDNQSQYSIQDHDLSMQKKELDIDDIDISSEKKEILKRNGKKIKQNVISERCIAIYKYTNKNNLRTYLVLYDGNQMTPNDIYHAGNLKSFKKRYIYHEYPLLDNRVVHLVNTGRIRGMIFARSFDQITFDKDKTLVLEICDNVNDNSTLVQNIKQLEGKFENITPYFTKYKTVLHKTIYGQLLSQSVHEKLNPNKNTAISNEMDKNKRKSYILLMGEVHDKSNSYVNYYSVVMEYMSLLPNHMFLDCHENNVHRPVESKNIKSIAADNIRHNLYSGFDTLAAIYGFHGSKIKNLILDIFNYVYNVDNTSKEQIINNVKKHMNDNKNPIIQLETENHNHDLIISYMDELNALYLKNKVKIDQFKQKLIIFWYDQADGSRLFEMFLPIYICEYENTMDFIWITCGNLHRKVMDYVLPIIGYNNIYNENFISELDTNRHKYILKAFDLMNCHINEKDIFYYDGGNYTEDYVISQNTSNVKINDLLMYIMLICLTVIIIIIIFDIFGNFLIPDNKHFI